jgi:hypothetical protein
VRRSLHRISRPLSLRFHSVSKLPFLAQVGEPGAEFELRISHRIFCLF